MKNEGRLTSLDGLFITHYHDDHTDRVNELLREHDCPVYTTPIMEDVLRRPGDYRLPCLTANAVGRPTVFADGHRMNWREFALTFYDFPGQTIYHSALLVERDTGEKIFFIGDSFTPSGLDDYCLQNRNLLRAGTGYPYCLDLLRNKIPSEAFLINQHVVEPFRFDVEQLTRMSESLTKRAELLSDLFPWDEPDYGIDEQWARIHPYGHEIKGGEWVHLTLKLLNHSRTSNTFTVSLNAPEGFEVESARDSAVAESGQEVEIRFRLKVPQRPSMHVVTADIQVGPWDLRQWCESLIKVLP